jgi:hypothetical protein
MASLVPYIWGIVFGFVYLAAFFFFILSLLRIHNLTPSPSIDKYVPYLAVIVIFASSITGFVAQTIISKVIGIIFPQDAFNATNPIASQQEVGVVYASLILIRHLFIATLLLGISLNIWLRNQYPRLRCYIPLSCYLFSILFLITYFCIRADFIQIKNTFVSIMHAP